MFAVATVVIVTVERDIARDPGFDGFHGKDEKKKLADET